MISFSVFPGFGMVLTDKYPRGKAHISFKQIRKKRNKKFITRKKPLQIDANGVIE